MRIIFLLSIALIGGCAFISEATRYRPADDDPQVSAPKPEEPALAMLRRQREKYAELTEGEKHGCIMKESGEIGDCGFVFDVWSSTQNVRDFIDRHCGGNNDKSCGKKISDAYSAQIQLRYPLADFNKVDLRCKAAGGCNLKQWEIGLMGSNNIRASDIWTANLLGDFQEQSRAQLEMADRVDAERRAMREINCFSDGYGGITCY